MKFPAVLLGALLSGGCSLMGAASAPGYDAEGQTKCQVGQSASKPLVVGWPARDRMALQQRAREGVVAVRVDGCHVELVPSCTPPGRYAYTATNRKLDHLSLRDQDELSAALPYAGERTFADGEAIHVAMTVVGRLETDAAVQPGDLGAPPCARATHVVRAITVGAFEVYEEGGAAERRLLSSDGSVAACDASTRADMAAPEACAAALRIEMVALRQEAPACPRGMQLAGGRCVVAAPVSATVSATVPGALQCAEGMVAIPAGEFTMGADGGYENEEPAHQLTIEAFCLDATEVTASAYDLCVRAGRCSASPNTVEHAIAARDIAALDDEKKKHWEDGLRWSAARCNQGRSGRGDHPMNCVDHRMATQYCGSLGKRLPTESEWEYAAKGGRENRRHPWGDGVPSPLKLNACGSECAAETRKRGDYPAWLFDADDGFADTSPVGRYPEGASRWGVQDLAGNVAEWTSSPPCPYARYACSHPFFVTRGSGWGTWSRDDANNTRRGGSDPSVRSPGIGFRCAR